MDRAAEDNIKSHAVRMASHSVTFLSEHNSYSGRTRSRFPKGKKVGKYRYFMRLRNKATARVANYAAVAALP